MNSRGESDIATPAVGPTGILSATRRMLCGEAVESKWQARRSTALQAGSLCHDNDKI